MGFFETISRGLERRDGELSGLASPAAWLFEALGVLPTDSGIGVSPQNALKYSAIYACINVLSQTIAQMPLDVWRRSGNARSVATDRTEHYLLHCEPIGTMSSFSFRQAFVANLLLYGNAFAEILRDGAGRTRALRILPAFTVIGYESADQERMYYRVTRINGTVDVLDGSDVIHVPYLSVDGVAGLSPIALHRQGIGLGLAAEAAGASFFGNGSRPSGYLSTPKALKKDDREDLEAKWFAKFGGSRNTGKVPLLSGDLKWNQLSIPPSDAQYIETRIFQAGDSARVYRVPAVLIGLADKTSTYASAEAFFQQYVTGTVTPLAQSIEQEFDRKLFPNTTDLYCKLDLKGLMRGDPKARAEWIKAMFSTGSIVQDEIREFEDMDELPKNLGKRPWIQQGFMPIDMADQLLLKQGTPPKAPADSGNQNGNQNQDRSAHVAWLADVTSRIAKWEKKDADRIAEAFLPVFRSLGALYGRTHAEAFCRQTIPGTNNFATSPGGPEALIDMFLETR